MEIMAASERTLVDPSLKQRRFIVLVFVLAIVGVGVPVWLHIMHVERVSLPYSDIARWAESTSSAQELHIRVRRTLVVSSKLQQQAFTTPKDTLIMLGNNARATVQWSLDTPREANCHSVHAVRSLVVLCAMEERLSTHTSEVDVVVEAGGATYIYCDRDNVASCTDKVAVYGEHIYGGLRRDQPTRDKSNRVAEVSTKRTRGFEVLFSLMVSDPDERHISWDIAAATAARIHPFLKSLQALGDFDIISQVQYFTDLPIRPTTQNNKDTSETVSVLTVDDLPHFINSAEWNLASSSSRQTTLHMLLFIPSRSTSPLIIVDRNGIPTSTNAFLIPGWGGIAVYNHLQTPKTDKTLYHLNAQELQQYMDIFRTQLRTLLGVPDWLQSGTYSNLRFQFDLPGAEGMTTLEQQLLYIGKTATALHDTKQTLTALVSLIEKLSSLPVNTNVAHEVRRCVNHLDAARALADDEYNDGTLERTATLVLMARQLAEDAFFDASMVAMVYFPDEHKYAVYMPLFVPVVFSFLVVLIKEVKQWKEKRRANAINRDQKQKTD